MSMSIIIIAVLLGVALHRNLLTDGIQKVYTVYFEVKEKVTIPTEENIEEWEEIYNTILTKTQALNTMRIELMELHAEVISAKVSSKANKSFNKLSENFGKYIMEVERITQDISFYEQKYREYLELGYKIPKYASMAREKYEIFIQATMGIYEKILQERRSCDEIQGQLKAAIESAHLRADELFYRDYYILTIICFYEARGCPDIEIAYVANVIENRILSPKFAYAHCADDVVWAPKQYEPTWTTPMNQTNARVQKIVEEYLRGRLETDMPDNVVYQAKFPQKGKEIWKIMDSGHYFCFE